MPKPPVPTRSCLSCRTTTNQPRSVYLRISARLLDQRDCRSSLRIFVPAQADENQLARPVFSSSIPVDRRRMRRGDFGVSELGFLLAGERERFVVMSRGRNSYLPSQLAFARAVPVLVTEPSSSLA
jgi:hypothetical protein